MEFRKKKNVTLFVHTRSIFFSKKDLQLHSSFKAGLSYLDRAGVAISVWTAMLMGTAPQWMWPKASLSAMLYLKSRPMPEMFL